MTMETVSVPTHLSTFLTGILKKLVEEERFDLNSEKDIKVTLVSDPEEQPSYKFKIKIKQEGRDDLDLFAKVIRLNPVICDKLKLKPFVKERLFYTSLMKTYRLLEQKHDLSETDRLRLPACYGAEAAHGNEILVLEDLTSRGFGLANRFVSISWRYAAAAVTELAKFHALSIAFQHENPTDFDTFTTQIPGGLFEENEESNTSLCEMLKSVAENAVRTRNRKNLKDFFQSNNFITSYNDLLKPSNLKVILHGHFWPKSMMHKVATDGSVEVIPLDYSTIQVGSPVTDLIHFIFSATDNCFREEYFEELIRHYYSELTHATIRLSLDLQQIYTEGDMKTEFLEKLVFGLYAAVSHLYLLAFDDREERVLGLPVNDETYRVAALQLYYHRINEVVDAYVDAGILQDREEKKRDRKEGQRSGSRCCRFCFIS